MIDRFFDELRKNPGEVMFVIGLIMFLVGCFLGGIR